MDFSREKLSEVPHNFHSLPPLLLFLLLPHFLSSNFFAKSSSGRDAERGREEIGEEAEVGHGEGKSTRCGGGGGGEFASHAKKRSFPSFLPVRCGVAVSRGEGRRRRRQL